MWGNDWLIGRYDRLTWDMLGCMGDMIAWFGICSVAWEI
ncbi:hypothetical protein ABIC55_000456 [Sporosarcina psychrophila]|uniref:Uncharacterized protein n=1 Tax=Sporosarcina psychrophila TaxID=1476 RepID=A0ABV2K2S1_SPOPS